jgi:hypothetical protein
VRKCTHFDVDCTMPPLTATRPCPGRRWHPRVACSGESEVDRAAGVGAARWTQVRHPWVPRTAPLRDICCLGRRRSTARSCR